MPLRTLVPSSPTNSFPKGPTTDDDLSPKRSARSQSADELDFYPSLNSTTVLSVKERIAQVQAHAKSRSQTNMQAAKPKPKGTKLASRSSGSLSRRSSAPLLGSPGSESKSRKQTPRVRPIDTGSKSYTYHRPGVTASSRLTSPAGQLSTFGTVYVPSWDTSRTESINAPRPSTAPLPNDTFASGDEQEGEELLGGIHYSTYGGRRSRIYDDDPSSPLYLYDGPFADSSVPVPEELKEQARNELARVSREREKEKGHKRVGSQVTAALLRKVGVESPPSEQEKDPHPQARMRRRTLSSIMLPASQSHVTLDTGTEQTHGTTSQEDSTLISVSKFPMPPAESDPLPPTPGSMSTVMPGTPGLAGGRPTTPGLAGARPTTPAVPDFLVVSRSRSDGTATPDSMSVPTEGEASSGSEARPKLRTRASLLALAMRRDSGGSPKTQSADSPKVEHSVDSSKVEQDENASKPQQNTNSSRPDANTSKTEPSLSNPRRRSMLERLTARLAGPSAFGQDESWVDESFTSDLEDNEELRRGLGDAAAGHVVSPVLEFDLPSEEPLIDLEQFGMMIGSSSPVRVQANSATFPPMQSSPPPFRPTPPTSPRNRTLSRLSTTGRRMLNKVERPLSGTFAGRGSRQRTISVFSTGSRASRKSRRRHVRTSNESTRPREGGRLESITRRASVDILSAEGATEGTVMYGVGEEMLRLMFGEPLSPTGDQHQLVPPQERDRERTRSLPRRVSTPKRPATAPHGNLVAARAVESENKAPGHVGLLPDFGGPVDLRFSNHTKTPASTSNVVPRRKGHKRGMASGSKENVSIRAKSPVQPKSRSRSKSAPLGFSAELSTSLDVKPAVGILTNGGSGRTTPNLNRGARVVIVNSATTPAMNTPKRQTTRSTPLAPTPATASGSASTSANTGVGSEHLTQPGVIVTAPTPPAPRRSLSMPLEGFAHATGAAESARGTDSLETPRGTASRGTSVQFVPESYEGRRSKSRKRLSNVSAAGPPVLEINGNGNGNGKGKRKVEREPTDAPDTSASSPFKKPKLSEDMDITFMGESLFGGHPQQRRRLGSIDRASSHHSSYSRHSQSYNPAPYPYPGRTTSPDPERSSIPIHAIITPRVQSLYSTKSEYASHRQSISSIPRPKSRASARSNATGRRSNMTGARSARSNRTGGSGKVGPRNWRDRLPLQGWCFILGFFVPFVWWYAAFARAERGYYGGGVWSREVESQWEGVRTDVHRDDERLDAHAWRFRCRLMAAVSIVVYVPVIVLAAVFA